jgi:hypothetical protein
MRRPRLKGLDSYGCSVDPSHGRARSGGEHTQEYLGTDHAHVMRDATNANGKVTWSLIGERPSHILY